MQKIYFNQTFRKTAIIQYDVFFFFFADKHNFQTSQLH